MQVSVEATEGLERKLTVEIPAEQIDSEVKKRISSTAKKVRLDGFRPGKVPVKVVKQRFGEALRAEVVGELANQSFQKAVMQEDLKPVGQPSIEPKKNEEGENFEFIATFEVYPEIELADCADFALTQYTSEVTDADVDAMIEKLRDQKATWEPVDRAAAEGDQVNIDYKGVKDGEEFSGGSAEGTDLELGSKRMIEGFEAGLVGAKAGEERKLDLTFPENYHAEDLKGAAVEFTVKVNSVSEKKLAELNSEFFADFEVDGDLDDFKTNVKENMSRQLTDSLANSMKTQVMDALYENNKFDLPAAMIADEINVLRQQSLQQFGAAAENFDLSMLPDELYSEQAERRVALGIILNKAVEHFEVKPDRDAVMAYIDEVAATYDDPEAVKNQLLGNENQLQQVQLMVVERTVVEKITEVAKVTEQSCTYDEALQGPGQQQEAEA